MRKKLNKSSISGNASTVRTPSGEVTRTAAEDSNYITILGMYTIDKQFLKEVEIRFDAIHHMMIEGIEYKAEELVWGRVFGTFDAHSFPEIVICLKHIAAKPDAPIAEVEWDTFELVTRTKHE